MQRPKQSAFTLVELIVVITILAILGTIAFISLQGYSATSRDSVRIADVGSMSTALEIFQVNSGKYPVPDNGGFFTYLGDPLWTQGNFGENVVKNLSRNFPKAPTDPLSDKEYIYSRAGNGNEFQILNLLEGDITLNTISQTNAAEGVRIPKIGGTYNGLYIKTKSYLVPIPSILTSLDFNEGDTSEISGTGILSQVITGGTNVPKYGNAKSGTGGIEGLQLSVADIVTSESTPTQKAAAMQKIQDAYSGSSLENEGIYEYILSVSGEDNLADLLETVVLNNAADIVITKNIEENVEESIESGIPLYEFISHTFTNCEQTGKTGPSLGQCTGSYSTVWDGDTSYFNMVTNGIQIWTVPETGTYRILGVGASGGGETDSTNTRPGYGASIRGDFNFIEGEKLQLLVGQSGGGIGGNHGGAGGGGGSFIVKGTILLIAAAGGNGEHWASHNVNGPDGRVSGGTGNGGSANRGSGGAGWLSNGSTWSSCDGGKSFNNGGGGSYGSCGRSVSMHTGGFGGGGLGGAEGGGGGGYTGGRVTPSNDYNNNNLDYGAQSYNSGLNKLESDGINNGNGYILIQKL